MDAVIFWFGACFAILGVTLASYVNYKIGFQEGLATAHRERDRK